MHDHTTQPKRRDVLKMGAAGIMAGLLPLSMGARAQEVRPNILWLVCEDLSPLLGCYGDAYATTPNIDAFAKRSVRYDRAYAPSPVCSPARTGLLFGRHATTTGSNNHRSRPVTDPDIRGYGDHLRKAGYWTSNHTKTDYNSSRHDQLVRACWDSDGVWRDRPDKAKPFMSVINLDSTHASRGMVWPYKDFVRDVQSTLSAEEIHDPADVTLPPYYPDTPTVRRTFARYHDCATHMDHEVGQWLAKLEEDGLSENTIVFFYSDHGTGLPMFKQTALEGGLRVPLLVHLPERWKHLADAPNGGATDRMVSFTDFGPTVIALAGAEVPDSMQGTPFLPADRSARRDLVFGARNRIDESLDVQRTITDGRYRYLRNFMPHLPHLQPIGYWSTSELSPELLAMHRAGTLPPAMEKLFGPKDIEELYDHESDPWEAHNLAADPEHAERLQQMRAALAAEMRRIGDLNMVQEDMLNDRGGEQPLTALDLPLDRILETAEMVGMASTADTAARLTDEDPAVRWWTVIALRQNADATEALRRAAEDDDALVAGEAALALLARGADGAMALVEKALAGGRNGYLPYFARTAIYSGSPQDVATVLGKLAQRMPDADFVKSAQTAFETLHAV